MKAIITRKGQSLPELTLPAASNEVAINKQAINQEGEIITGSAYICPALTYVESYDMDYSWSNSTMSWKIVHNFKKINSVKGRFYYALTDCAGHPELFTLSSITVSPDKQSVTFAIARAATPTTDSAKLKVYEVSCPNTSTLDNFFHGEGIVSY